MEYCYEKDQINKFETCISRKESKIKDAITRSITQVSYHLFSYKACMSKISLKDYSQPSSTNNSYGVTHECRTNLQSGLDDVVHKTFLEYEKK